MVDKKESTRIVTQSKYKYGHTPSFKRWLKHCFYLKQASNYFSQIDYEQITEAVKHAEKGHIGEIQIVIEAHLPFKTAYYQNTTSRAQQLFAELGVWDTELNSGILLYINLCDSRVELVFDRGIHQHTEAEKWTIICQHIVRKMKQKQYVNAVEMGVKEIGLVLNQYYTNLKVQGENLNELSNHPMIL